jgi:hypothetical protein
VLNLLDSKIIKQDELSYLYDALPAPTLFLLSHFLIFQQLLPLFGASSELTKERLFGGFLETELDTKRKSLTEDCHLILKPE